MVISRDIRFVRRGRFRSDDDFEHLKNRIIDSVRTNGLDNPEARIEVRAGEDAFAAVLWVSEIDDVKPFDEIQEQILDLARRLSDGEVLEGGR